MNLPTWLSWSSGKDSAYALYKLKASSVDVVGLLTTLNEALERVAIHSVRRELLQAQADRLRLPLNEVHLPWPCSNEAYGERMSAAHSSAEKQGVRQIAFGDLFLADIRAFRESQLKSTQLKPIFPLWSMDTQSLAKEIIQSGIRAVVTCVDPKSLAPDFVGRPYDENFLSALPQSVDPCGEKGEFHTFVYDSPLFSSPIPIQTGEVMKKDGFIFADILSAQ